MANFIFEELFPWKLQLVCFVKCFQNLLWIFRSQINFYVEGSPDDGIEGSIVIDIFDGSADILERLICVQEINWFGWEISPFHIGFF